MEYVIGLDLGTGSIKGIALDKNGEVVLKHSESYPLYNNRYGHSEQDPEDWYNASVKVLEKITNNLGGDGLRAISISGQMHCLVLLDNEKKPIRRSILWNDTRTTKQCQYIMNNFEILTAQDIAKLLKVSRATAYEIMDRDDFPTIRIGRNKRVMAHEFMNWIQNQTNKQLA